MIELEELIKAFVATTSFCGGQYSKTKMADLPKPSKGIRGKTKIKVLGFCF